MIYLHELTEWLKTHPFLYPFILFLIGLLVSIYAQDVRRFLHEWPRTKARQARRNAAARRLELLERLHNNSYELLLYFGIQFVGMIFEWLAFSAPLFIVGWFSKVTVQPSTFVGLLIGVFLGTCKDARTVLKQLSSYEQSVSELQHKVSK